MLTKENNITNQFKISNHFAIYFSLDFDDDEIKYYQMKNIDGNIELSQSNFQDLFELINEKALNLINNPDPLDFPEDFFSVQNETTKAILRQIKEYTNAWNTRQNILENIYIECKYNIFSHYTSIDGLIRFLERYNSYILKNEVLYAEISENVKQGITQPQMKNLRKKHKQILDEFINEDCKEKDLRNNMHLYLKYITAHHFSESFCLLPGLSESISYQVLYSVIFFPYKDNVEQQYEQLRKNIQLYDCLSYNDMEFNAEYFVLEYQ